MLERESKVEDKHFYATLDAHFKDPSPENLDLAYRLAERRFEARKRKLLEAVKSWSDLPSVEGSHLE